MRKRQEKPKQVKSPKSLGYNSRCGSERCTILRFIDWLATVHLHTASATICDRDCQSKTRNVVIGLEHLPVCSVDFSSPQSPLFLVGCDSRSLPTREHSRCTTRYKKSSNLMQCTTSVQPFFCTKINFHLLPKASCAYVNGISLPVCMYISEVPGESPYLSIRSSRRFLPRSHSSWPQVN
jgi:hypothetical protein